MIASTGKFGTPEGQDLSQVQAYASEIADTVRAALGAAGATPQKTAPERLAVRA